MTRHTYKLNKVPKRKHGDKIIQVMDPIHNFIDISEYPVIQQLIDTPHFQRLRRLYQLGLTSSVYPNATHSRFAHSIGVMHVFLILFDSVSIRSNLSQDKIEKLRPLGAVSALLHDIGHGPFSHASEKFLEDGTFDHETLTRDIIRKTSIKNILKKNKIDPQLVCDILKHEVSGDLLIVSQLISSQLDADRLDYLMRDSFFSGAPYGKIDVYRIANTLQIWDEPTPKAFKGTIVVSNKGLEAIEDYVLGRYLMYRGVYFHKVSRCMEHFLYNIFKRVLDVPKELKDLKKLVNVSKKITPKIILNLDDYVCYSLFHKWKNSDDKILRDLSNRILDRKILKAHRITPTDLALIGLRKMPEISNVFKRTKFNFDYYFIQDNEKKSAYEPYTVKKIDDEHTAISHIMVATGKNNELKEITQVSPVVEALSKDGGISHVRLFYPKELSQKVSKIVST